MLIKYNRPIRILQTGNEFSREKNRQKKPVDVACQLDLTNCDP